MTIDLSFFYFDLPASVSKSQSADCYFHPINESTANCFAEAYVKSPVSSIIEASGPSLDTEELTVVFNSVCLDIINDVALIRLKKHKSLSQPWFNNETRALRQACRKAERRWKRDK